MPDHADGRADVDVAIVGGGPAGTAAALTLLRYSTLRVALVERTRYERWRAGETLPPGVAPLLRYLDAHRLLESHPHLPAHGTAAAWGADSLLSRDFLFTGRGTGWHVDRAAFDRALAAVVAERGGVVMLDATMARAAWRDHRWQLDVQRERVSPRLDLTARFVIDASGRRAVFGRRQGARRAIHDQLFGLVGCCSFAGGPPHDTWTVVEAGPLGWWYSALLPDRRMAVAFMTDADIIRQHRLHLRSSWWALLQSTVHTRHRVTGGAAGGAPEICPAFSQILHPIAGERWLAAGDAAVGFDPLSSMGIGYAITSGIHAARAVHDALTAGGPLLAEYTASIDRHYTRYLARRRQYYAMERRWKDAPFWARRVDAPVYEAAWRAGSRSGFNNSP